jgi:hypothetical protein
MNAHALALLMQFFSMNQQDVYVYTLPNVYRTTLTYQGRICPETYNSYGNIEQNPVSAWLIGNKVPDLCYVGGCLGAVGITSLLSDFDNQHLKGFPFGTADIFTTLLTLAEINAIHSWAVYNVGPVEQNWTLAKIVF